MRTALYIRCLLQNEVWSHETHLEVSRSIIDSPRPRQSHGNEQPNRCTLFVREQAGIVIFPLSENEEPRLDAHSLRGMEI